MVVHRAKRVVGDGRAKRVFGQGRAKAYLGAVAHRPRVQLPNWTGHRVVGGAGPFEGDLPVRGELLDDHIVGRGTILCTAIVHL